MPEVLPLPCLKSFPSAAAKAGMPACRPSDVAPRAILRPGNTHTATHTQHTCTHCTPTHTAHTAQTHTHTAHAQHTHTQHTHTTHSTHSTYTFCFVDFNTSSSFPQVFERLGWAAFQRRRSTRSWRVLITSTQPAPSHRLSRGWGGRRGRPACQSRRKGRRGTSPPRARTCAPP